MDWAAWFFLPDVWLIREIVQGGFWSPLFLAFGSVLANTTVTVSIFLLLIHLGKRVVTRLLGGHYFFRTIGNQFQAALDRRNARGAKMKDYIEKWRHYRYVILFLLNMIPLIPWITGGSICYGVATRNPKALLSILAGLSAKVVVIAIAIFIGRWLL